jgi:hypothetical protein
MKNFTFFAFITFSLILANVQAVNINRSTSCTNGKCTTLECRDGVCTTTTAQEQEKVVVRKRRDNENISISKSCTNGVCHTMRCVNGVCTMMPTIE